MSWLADFWDQIAGWLPAVLVLLNALTVVLTIGWVLMTKTDSTSAVAWCLLVLFLPFVGALSFFVFGYQHVNRPLKRKRKHKLRYRSPTAPAQGDSQTEPARIGFPRNSASDSLSRLASRCGAYPVTFGNEIDFYHDGGPAIDGMIEAIQGARHHIHILVFIFQPDNLGRQFIDLLAAKAREGVEVRLLYDAMGSLRLGGGLLRRLHEAGGKSSVFLPLNLFRRRLQVNMRNHRKIIIVDGKVGFVGGLNIGDEYLGRVARFGYWRDTHIRVKGPAVCDLQRLFVEDWSFASGENVDAARTSEYFPVGADDGPYPVQVVDSGPDRDMKAIRELTFAAILKAQHRLWIASPYFVPDAGLLDALRLAAYNGVDVRLLGQLKPDKWVPQFAARYYWGQVLPAGIKVYQYKRGMMHAKVMLVDDEFAVVGTANLDNRSMHLNFEVNCLIYSEPAVAHLEQVFLRDFEDAVLLERAAFARRPFVARLAENACRLLSPIL